MQPGYGLSRRVRTVAFLIAALAAEVLTPTTSVAQGTRVRIDSEPGAWPGNQHLDVVPGPTNLTLSSLGPRFGATATLSGFGPTWVFQFAPANGVPFGPGVYDPAATTNPMVDLPTLQVKYDNSYTTRPTGRYEIRKATWDATGRNLTSFWAVLRFTASNRFGPGVNAEIRWNADTSLYLRCPRVAMVYSSDSASIPLAGVDTRGRPVTLTASPLPPGASLVTTGNGTALLRWPSTPSAENSYAVRITATNDEGLQDTSLTVIRVVHRFQFSITGAATDPVTLGSSIVLQRPDVTFYKTVGPTILGTDIWSWYDNHDWDVYPPAFPGMTEGTYERIQVQGLQSSEEAGVNFASFGRACSSLDDGRMIVRRLRMAPDGALASLWARLEQTCANAAGGSVAELRWNCDTTLDVQAPVVKLVTRDDPVRFDVTSFVAGGGPARLEALQLPAGAAFTDRGDGTGEFDWGTGPPVGTTASAMFRAVAPSGTSDTVTSRIQSRVPFLTRLFGTPGGYVFLGRDWRFQSPDHPVLVTEAADSSLTVAVHGQAHSWAFTFSAPSGRRLTTGVYDSTHDDHAQLTPRARFRAGRDGVPAGYRTRFHVRRLARSPSGAIRSLWATFSSAEGPEAPADSGEIRVDVDTTLYVVAPGEVARPVGVPFTVHVRAVEATGASVTFSLLSAPPGAGLVDHGDGTASVEVPGALPAGLWPVLLRTASASGAADTATVMLRALAPASFTAVSDNNDPVALGLDESCEADNAFFRVARAANGGVRATVATSGHVWTLGFWAPKGAPLAPGRYEHPILCNGCSSIGAAPRLDVVQDGRFCASGVDGWFDVRRVRHAPDGSVRSLWVVFDQACLARGGVRGELRFDADTSVYLRVPIHVATEVGRSTPVAVSAVDTRGLPVTIVAPSPPPGSRVVDHGDGTATLEWEAGPAAPGAVTVTWIATSSDGRADTASTVVEAFRTARFVLQGAPGDPVSQGGSLRLTGSDGTVTTTAFSDSTVNVRFSGSGRELEFNFRAPFRNALREGVFTRARRYQTQELDQPGLMVKVDGRLCDMDSASFHVRRLRRDAAGAVVSLWATFVQRCAGNSAVLSGEVQLSADTSVYIEAPAEVSRVPGQAVALDIAAVDTRGLGVTLTAFELPAGAVFTPTGPGLGHLEWSAGDSVGSVHRIGFAALSADGSADTVVTLVRTFAPDTMRIVSVPGDYIGQGRSYGLDARNGTFRLTRSGSALAIDWTGLRDAWRVQIAVPYGRAPAPGRYEGAVDVNARSLPQPGISVSTTGRGDTAKRGRLEIRKLALGPNDLVEALWMTFESSLTSGPGLTGEARIGQPDTTYWLDAPADVFADRSQTVSFEVVARGALVPVERWMLENAPLGCSLVGTSDSTASVRWQGTTLPGNYAVTVSAAGVPGVERSTTWIHVAGTSYIELHAGASYFLPQGLDRRFLDRDGTFACWRNANNALSVVLDAPWNHGRWDLSRADGQRIVPGSYPVTGSIPPLGTSPNGIYFVWNSLVPGVKDGRFEVLEATYSPTDSLTSLVATFEMNLLNTTLPFRGEIHLPGTDLATPVRVSLIEATWTGTGARARWHLPGRVGSRVGVERDHGSGWEHFGMATVDGLGHVIVEDAGPLSGLRVGYRLRAPDGTAFPAEAWIEVPPAAAFDLHRLGPNPGKGPIELVASTIEAGPASLELLDVAGRVIEHRSWDALPAGRHVVTLDGVRARSAGVYFVRLESRGRSLTRSFVILR